MDAAGVPLGLAADEANRHDKKLAEATLESVPVHRDLPGPGEPPQHLCLDKGYDDDIRQLVAEFAFTAHVRARGEEARELKREAGEKARRWVVERTHIWMNRFRCILVRWEKKANNYVGLLHPVCGWITYRAAGLPGQALRREADKVAAAAGLAGDPGGRLPNVGLAAEEDARQRRMLGGSA